MPPSFFPSNVLSPIFPFAFVKCSVDDYIELRKIGGSTEALYFPRMILIFFFFENFIQS